MTSKLFAVLFLALTNAFILESVETVFGKSASSQFIYGKVTTHDGDEYQGQIRWGKEEAFWFDFFNSVKIENENLKWLTREEEKALKEEDSASTSWWGSIGKSSWSRSWGNSDKTHVFACQFGDIKSIELHGGERVTVEFKNGEKYELEGGSNDIGTKVQVSDSELGMIKLDWHRISHIEFMQGPADLESAYGEPLYGIVKTIKGEFEGFLQWDHDERLSHDILNGDTEDGELEIEFGKIKSIKRSHKGSLVTLKSGRSFTMWGTNDVNEDNRGIIVSTPNYGRVDISWDEFEELIIADEMPNAVMNYADYRGFNRLHGTVHTLDGRKLTGDIVYDLDEKYQLEILDGVADRIEYLIPFGAVKSIKPMNRKESRITLTNGESFLLEDKVDVNENNDGILVFDGKKPSYIKWSEVDTITFE